jgi:hypothetical protein
MAAGMPVGSGQKRALAVAVGQPTIRDEPARAALARTLLPATVAACRGVGATVRRGCSLVDPELGGVITRLLVPDR